MAQDPKKGIIAGIRKRGGSITCLPSQLSARVGLTGCSGQDIQLAITRLKGSGKVYTRFDPHTKRTTYTLQG